MLTNGIVSFEQLGPGFSVKHSYDKNQSDTPSVVIGSDQIVT